jgi:sulfoquinovosidase
LEFAVLSLRGILLLASAALSLALMLLLARVAVAEPAPVFVANGEGVRVEVRQSPFALRIVDTVDGTTLDEAPSDDVPLRATGTSPQPDIVGDRGGYGPLSFVVGRHATVQYPTVLWSGDDLLGGDAGAAYHPTALLATSREGSTVTLDVSTDAPGSPTATIVLSFGAPEQVRVEFTPPQDLPVSAVGDAFVSAPGERFFGFGERKDAVDQRGLYREAFAQEENFDAPQHQYWTDQVPAMGPKYTFPNGAGASYHPESSYLSSRGYGMLIDGSAPSQYDMAASDPSIARFQTFDSTLDYTVQFGGARRAIAGLTAITGRNAPPPSFALEPQIDALVTAGNITSTAAMESDVATMAETVRKDDLPVKVLGVEAWSSIPAADATALAAKLRGEGFVPYAYFWPFVSPDSQQYTDAARLGLLITNAAGQPYIYSGEGGTPVAMWDFTNPATVDYWERNMVGRALDMGFQGFMLDFGEEIQPGMRFHSGESWWTEHNAYTVQYARAAHEAVERWRATHDGRPVFFYTRSGYTGEAQWSSGVFPGDEATDWSAANGIGSLIPAMVNLSVSGTSMWTTDIAGYSEHDGAATPELYQRWTELAALSPMMRVHSSEGGQRWPWSSDDQTLAIYRTYAQLHERLVPYLAAAAQQTAHTGIGIARPLWLQDMTAPESALEHEYLLGDELLVAPVLDAGATKVTVYLPKGGDWQPMRVTPDGRLASAGAAAAGGTSFSIAVGPADIPVFLRKGAANPAA